MGPSSFLARYRGLCAATVVLALAGACGGASAERWERPEDHAPAGVTETSDCRVDARRQAEARYPQQPIEQIGRLPNYDDDRRFPAEMTFYRDCMRRKGYVRVE